MKITNTTDLPTDLLRDVVRFVRPSGIGGFSIRLTNCSARLCGRAYSNHVIVRIGASRFFPFTGREHRHRGGYLPIPWLADRTEALVYVTAHELRHLWQQRVPRGWRVWGARGQFSERDADAYAIRMLRAWRRRPTRD